MLKYLAMAAVAVASLTACSSESEESLQQGAGQLVQFSMSVNASRTQTADDDARTTTWVDGDAVGIFVYKHGTKELVKVNAKYVLGGNVWTAADEESKIYATEAYDFYAYYPYDAAAIDPTKVLRGANADQTTAEAYAKSDFLSAKNLSVLAGTTNVSLSFSHLFSLVEVKVQGDKVTQRPEKVTLNNVKLAAEIDLTADIPAATLTADAGVGTVVMYPLATGDAANKAPFVFRAIVPAQQVAAGTSLVDIENPAADGKTYTMSHPEAVTYEAGKCRQIIVTIAEAAKPALTIPATDFTFNPWGTSESISGEVEAIIPNLVPELTAETTLNKLKGDPKDEGWFMRYALDDDKDKISLIDAEVNGKSVKAIDVQASTSFGWYKLTAGYLSKQAASTQKKYKLSFDVKSAEGGKVQFIIRNAANDASFLIDKLPYSVVSTYTSKTDDWVSFSQVLDFSKKRTGSPTNAEADNVIVASVADDVAAYQIRFYAGSKTTSFRIANIRMEEYAE